MFRRPKRYVYPMKTICFRRHNIILHSDVFGEKRAEDENLEKNYEKNLLSQKKMLPLQPRLEKCTYIDRKLRK